MDSKSKIVDAINDLSQIKTLLVKLGSELPPPFIHDRSPLSSYLSISTLGTKSNRSDYLLPQEDDICATRPLAECELDKECNIYKDTKGTDKCVNPSRIKPFRELSKEMGNRIQGKFTVTPFQFIIHDSTSFYKLVLSVETRHLYVLFNIGSYIHDFAHYDLTSLVKRLLRDREYKIVLCGHSMGGSLALKTAEMIITKNDEFFRERCTVVALAPFPALDAVLVGYENIFVYFVAVTVNDHLYVDPVYFMNSKGRKLYTPFRLLHLDKEVTEVVTDTITARNETFNETVTKMLSLENLHNLNIYLTFFYLLYSKISLVMSGGKYNTIRKNKSNKSNRNKRNKSRRHK